MKVPNLKSKYKGKKKTEEKKYNNNYTDNIKQVKYNIHNIESKDNSIIGKY